MELTQADYDKAFFAGMDAFAKAYYAGNGDYDGGMDAMFAEAQKHPADIAMRKEMDAFYERLRARQNNSEAK